MMTNGFGAILGSWSSGLIIDNFFKSADGSFQWSGIWFSFAAYSLVVAITFALLFKHKHNPQDLENFKH